FRIGAITNAATTTPRICITCCFHGVEPTSCPHLRSCRLSPPIAAAQHTTPPISTAATGPAGDLSPSPRSSSAETRIVEIVIPDTGLFDEPTRPAMYDATAENRNPAITMTTAITAPIHHESVKCQK